MSPTRRRFELLEQRFDRLLVVAPVGRTPSGFQWQCRCDCGASVVATSSDLSRRRVISCGCAKRDRAQSGVAGRVHGAGAEGHETPEYRSFRSMIGRCTVPTTRSYNRYGGRGISVCDRWRHSFENFLIDVGRKPTPLHTIDRYPDRDGNYEPGNVRWATRKEQAVNRGRK